jgi:hypothetical protein
MQAMAEEIQIVGINVGKNVYQIRWIERSGWWDILVPEEIVLCLNNMNVSPKEGERWDDGEATTNVI